MPIQLPAAVPISTLQAYVRNRIIDPNERESAFLTMLRKRKRMAFNKDGTTAVTWPIEYMRQDIEEQSGAANPIALPNINPYVQASLPWSWYRLGNSVTKPEKLSNKGQSVIFNLVESKLKKTMTDFIEGYRLRLYQDGSRTQAGLYGLLSMFGSSATPTFYSTDKPIYNQTGGTGGYVALTTAQTGGVWPVCQPTATYGGVSTVLGTKSPDWNAGNADVAYPLGMYSPSYNFNSPLIYDYNSRYFTPNSGVSATVHSWDSQWQAVCNTAAAQQQTLRAKGIHAFLLSADLLSRAENSTIGQQRFIPTDAFDSKVLGIKSLKYNSMEFITEWGVPDNAVFGINWDRMNLWSAQKDIVTQEKDTDIVTLEDLLALDAYTQMWMDSAAFFVLLCANTAQGT